MYLYKKLYIGGLMEYISKKVAAYGQFVLVSTSVGQKFADHDDRMVGTNVVSLNSF